MHPLTDASCRVGATWFRVMGSSVLWLLHHQGARIAAEDLGQRPPLSDRRGRQRDPTSVPVDIIPPVEILPALQEARRLGREEWCQVKDRNARRPQFTFKAIEVIALPRADGSLIDKERPVHRVLARDEDNQQIEARLLQLGS